MFLVYENFKNVLAFFKSSRASTLPSISRRARKNEPLFSISGPLYKILGRNFTSTPAGLPKVRPA
jgi:hypothetical protein